MNTTFLIPRETWDKVLFTLLEDFVLYAPIPDECYQDYQILNEGTIDKIIYNTPKPTTPLKTFFLPVKENVVKIPHEQTRRIILGIPSCDLAALDMLDAIYLEEPYIDPCYRQKRESTILIGTDCHSHLEHCHCTTYGIHPHPFKNHDLALSVDKDKVWLTTNSKKGDQLLETIPGRGEFRECNDLEIQELINRRTEIETSLNEVNSRLLNDVMTGSFIKNSDKEIWQKYAGKCVTCGACATICPTCTCFLLIDRPEFEKVRQLDACQYPAFERVAAGEDPLDTSYIRFRNRYMCKYIWKPSQFNSTACTGCGRCIEACIGGINKNELFHELYQVLV